MVLFGFIFDSVGGDDGSSNLSNVEVSKVIESHIYLLIYKLQTIYRRQFLIEIIYLVRLQVYCPKTDTWRILPASMGIGRSYAGVCIIDKPM